MPLQVQRNFSNLGAFLQQSMASWSSLLADGDDDDGPSRSSPDHADAELPSSPTHAKQVSCDSRPACSMRPSSE